MSYAASHLLGALLLAAGVALVFVNETLGAIVARLGALVMPLVLLLKETRRLTAQGP